MEKFTNGYALIIGVGRDLPATVKDAQAIYDVLTDEKRAGYPASQVQLLTGQAATKQGILTALETLHQNVAGNEQATVVIYYSGHGGELDEPWNGGLTYYLLPYDYDTQDYATTCIPAKEFVEKVDGLNAGKLVLLLDCCHAGGFKKAGRGDDKFRQTPKQLVNELDKGSGRVIVASSQAEQLSYIGKQYSIFTECLLEAFQGKNTPKQEEYVSINQLIDFVGKEVPQRAKAMYNEQQVPITRMEASHFSICKNEAAKTNSIMKIDQNFELESLQKRYKTLQAISQTLNGQINALEQAVFLETNVLNKTIYEQKIVQLKEQLEVKDKEKEEVLEKIQELS